MSSDIFKDYPDIVEISQLMEMLNISKYSAYKLVTENKIGSLYEKHNYWVMVLYGLSAALYPEKNITDLSQKKKRWISTSLPSTAKNKRTAEKMLYDNLKKYELEENRILADPDSYSSQPNYASGGQVLFTDYLTDWLERKKNKIQLITWEGYEVYARRHIIPYFNELNLTLAELKPRHFADYYEYKFSGGRLDRKKGGLGNRSLRSHAQLIKAVLNEAVIYEYILRNPAEKVPIPRKPKTESDSTKNVYMTAEEANDMLHKLRGEWIQPIVFIALLYGLRKSEVLGIKWSAVDFEKNTIEINHTVVKHKSIVYQDSTKTENSRNTFELLPEARELLLDIHARQERNREICGNGYYESDYVFTWDDGHLFRPDAITVSFQRALKRHGLPEMRFHDLRHSTASICFDKGWDIEKIKVWLRHADIETTSNIYTHISKNRQHILADAMTGTFSL